MDSDSDSFIALDSDGEEGYAAAKKSSKAKSSRPVLPKNNSSSRGGNYSFLTAAEQREQDRKDEKKDTESPYSFLLDIKDVGVSFFSSLPSEIWFLNRKTEWNLESLNTILELYIYRRVRGRPSRLLKNRYI